MSVKVKQDDLRRLMKERRENPTQKDKIDSPFARYSSNGQLSCSICNVIIKSNNLWGFHLSGKSHKENLHKGKRTMSESTSQTAVIVGSKRALEQPVGTKKLKSTAQTSLAEPTSFKKDKAPTLLATYSSSSDEMDIADESESLAASVPNANNGLPSDFFDNPSSNTNSSTPTIQPEKEKIESLPEKLPEGFFDDPMLDAKARNIEYKDPVEEEWEKFQKTIAEETNVSKTIIEEDLEESTLERDIVQIDEQIHQWERVKNLQCLADDVKLKAPQKDGMDGLTGSEDDDLEEDDLMDWRSKSIKKL